MSINPLTLLEKAINEHGSSAILKERIKLASDQYEDIARKNSDLIAENQSLKTQLQQAQDTIDEFQRTIEDLQSKQGADTLSDVTVRILEYFFDVSHNPTIEEVSSQMRLELGVVSYHFDLLREQEFVQQATVESSGSTWIAGSAGTPATYRITPNGRKHVVEIIRS